MIKTPARKLSEHAKQRIRERADDNDFAKMKMLGIYASKNGIPFKDYKKARSKTPLINYIEHKKRRYPYGKYYLYRGYIYVYSSNKSKVITMYKIPKCYEEEYNSYLEYCKLKKDYTVKKYNSDYKIVLRLNNQTERVEYLCDLDKLDEFLPIMIKGVFYSKKFTPEQTLAYLNKTNGIKITKRKVK